MTIRTAYTIVVGTFLFVLVFLGGLYLGRRQTTKLAPNVQTDARPNLTEPQAQNYQSATSSLEEGNKEATVTSQAEPARPDTSKLDDLVAKYNINLRQIDQSAQQEHNLSEQINQDRATKLSVAMIEEDESIKLLDEMAALRKTVVSQHSFILADPDHDTYYREGLYPVSHGTVEAEWADFHFLEHK